MWKQKAMAKRALPLSPQALHAHSWILSPPNTHLDLHYLDSLASGCLSLSEFSKPPSMQILHKTSGRQIYHKSLHCKEFVSINQLYR